MKEDLEKGKKCILASDIAIQHDVRLDKLNSLINNNIIRFNNNDLIDLLKPSEGFKDFVKENKLITSNRTKNLYLLSERGYTKLVSMMDNTNDKKWEVMDNLIDEYFVMRKIINSNEQLKANLLLSIYNGGQEGIIASKQLSDIEVKEATKPLLNKIEEDKPKVEFADTVSSSNDSIDIGTFSKLIKEEGIKLGRNKLFEWLRDNKYLMKNNQPYQKYIDSKYFEVIEYSYIKNGENKIGIKTLITGNGQIKLVEKLKMYI